VKEDGATQVLTVELLKGVSPKYRLTIETEKAVEKMPDTFALETPHALDVKRETGLVALSGNDELGLTVETAQHYLYFSAEGIGDGQTLFKCAPPIRDAANQQKLWDALLDGTIDFVATDHSPATPALKELATGDLTRAWGGISSLQLALPVLWTAARKRGASLFQLMKWLGEGPAALSGQSASRGIIAPGYAANLVVWEPDKTFRVSEEMLFHKHKLTPYLGEELYGIVRQTYLHGQKVFDQGLFAPVAGGDVILGTKKNR